MAEIQDNVITEGFKATTRRRIVALSQQSNEVTILMSPKRFVISRVPPRFRRDKDLYYEPSVISIGPYHQGKGDLEAMEEHKWSHLEFFLARRPQVINTDHLITMLYNSAADVRFQYFEQINLTNGKLIEMLLLDGCFIVETILRWSENRNLISYSSWFARQIWEDLLLFENQIPFSILNNLYRAIAPDNDSRFVDIVQEYLQDRTLPMEMKRSPGLADNQVCNHLLQLFYLCTISEPESVCPTTRCVILKLLKWLNPVWLVIKVIGCIRSSVCEQKNRVDLPAVKVPNATKLKDSGITFKAKVSNNFVDITFNHGLLEIPPIVLDSQRKTRLMNLIAFEQSNKRGEVLASYAEFMDNIIDTEKDVEILLEAGIIVSYLRDNMEIALFFNQLSERKSLSFNHRLAPVMRKIKDYAEVDWHTWRANLKGNYFSNPWTTISFAAALILLVLTALQTAYTMKTYYHPSS